MILGTFLAGAGYWVRTRPRRLRGTGVARLQATAVIAGLTVLYCAAAYLLFVRYYWLVPLVVPVAVQFPVSLLLALLAPPVVHEQHIAAVCVATDAAGSTALGQRLAHRDYTHVMNAYTERLARCVHRRGGIALPPEGDGFSALWLAPPGHGDRDSAINSDDRLNACLAALEIATAAAQVWRDDEDLLPARAGLTVGTVTMHSDADRGVFKVFGDTVNVAARVLNLNQVVGTRVIATKDVVDGLEAHLDLRPLHGPFDLKGIAVAPQVFEIQSAVIGALSTSGGRLRADRTSA